MAVLTWIVVIIVVVVLFVIFLFNRLVQLRNEVKNSWAQIDVQLKRRFDLIPNLVKSVKGYMKHEKGLLTEITRQRTAVMQAASLAGKAKASGKLSDAIRSLLVNVENYPQLRASENVMQLQEELTGTENKIAYSRQHYNDIVMLFNNRIQVFPNNMIAGMLGFKEHELFETSEAEKKPVHVEL